jgi:hypothetical protein
MEESPDMPCQRLCTASFNDDSEVVMSSYPSVMLVVRFR